MMVYDFRQWIENEGFNRRTPRLQRLYAAPFLLFPASFAITFSNGFGSAWLAILGPLFKVMGLVCALAVIDSPFLRDVWRSWKPRPGPVLDERERLAIAQAQVQSYVVIVAAIIVAFTYAGLANDFGWWLPHTAEHLDDLQMPVFAMI